MKYGFIYCLSNPCMPGIYKIGMTERSPQQRIMELSDSTSVPTEFELAFYLEVESPRQIESAAHAAFDSVRVSENREFFRCDPLDVYEWARCNVDILSEVLDGDLIFRLHRGEDAKFNSKHNKSAADLERIMKEIISNG